MASPPINGGGLTIEQVLLTGVAGALAEAVSMAAGKYLATTSQDEVLEAELRLERIHIRDHRDLELNRLREDAQSWLPNSVALLAAARTASSTSARNPRSSRTCTAAAVVPPGDVTWERSSEGDLPVSVSRCPAPRIV